MTSPAAYSRTQIALHWIVALLFVAQFVLHEPMAEAWDVIEDGGTAAFNPLVAAHVAGGILIMAFAAWRIALRRTRGVPDLPAGDGPMVRLAAHAGHMALYALMVLMPLSGMAAWFGGIEVAAELHEAMKPLIILLVAVHAGAAIWHQIWLRDGLMRRMSLRAPR